MAQEILSIPIKVRFRGHDANDHRVEAHAGTYSLHGITRSLQIISHAYLNMEGVSRGTALKDAEIFLTNARPGSLLFDFDLSVMRKKVGVTLSRENFYDFASTVLSRAVGREYKPATSYVTKLDAESDIIDIAVEGIDTSLKDAHRAIGKTIDGMSIERARSPLIYFDPETKEYVEASIPADDWEMMEGHVTRFNAITGNGRAYMNKYERTVPFKLADKFPTTKRGLITWSLHGSNIHTAKNLRFDSKTISSSGGVVKRLIVQDCNQVGDDD